MTAITSVDEFRALITLMGFESGDSTVRYKLKNVTVYIIDGLVDIINDGVEVMFAKETDNALVLLIELVEE